MFRIRWRDPSLRRRLYAGFHFDEDGRSTKAWPKRTDLRLKRLFMLNQHRQWFEVVEDAPAGACVEAPSESNASGGGEVAEASPPSSDSPEVVTDDDSDSDERVGSGPDVVEVRAEVPERDVQGPGHLGEEDSGERQEGRTPWEDEEPETLNLRKGRKGKRRA